MSGKKRRSLVVDKRHFEYIVGRNDVYIYTPNKKVEVRCEALLGWPEGRWPEWDPVHEDHKITPGDVVKYIKEQGL